MCLRNEKPIHTGAQGIWVSISANGALLLQIPLINRCRQFILAHHAYTSTVDIVAALKISGIFCAQIFYTSKVHTKITGSKFNTLLNQTIIFLGKKDNNAVSSCSQLYAVSLFVHSPLAGSIFHLKLQLALEENLI